jgi:hypothetical protein
MFSLDEIEEKWGVNLGRHMRGGSFREIIAYFGIA